MGFIEVESFCCGFTNLDKGCRLISLVTMTYSCLLFSLSCTVHGTKEEAQAAFILLILTTLLLYGVIERIRIAVIIYLILRALAMVLILAEMMRTLAQVLHEVKALENTFFLLLLEAGDFFMNIYFWLVVFSFCRRMSRESEQPPFPPEPNSGYIEEHLFNRPEFRHFPQPQQPQSKFHTNGHSSVDHTRLNLSPSAHSLTGNPIGSLSRSGKDNVVRPHPSQGSLVPSTSGHSMPRLQDANASSSEMAASSSIHSMPRKESFSMHPDRGQGPQSPKTLSLSPSAHSIARKASLSVHPSSRQGSGHQTTNPFIEM